MQHAHKVIGTIRIQPYLFKSAHSQNIRKAFIIKQTSMFYEVHTAHITILLFWDNRQEPILQIIQTFSPSFLLLNCITITRYKP